MNDSDNKKAKPAAGPAIILVEPQLGENIGMVARAMANFGLSELRLVNPRDGWPNDKARAAASRADHVIDGVVLFDDLASAVADLNFVFATTARERDGFKPVRGPVEAGGALKSRASAGEKTGILFGRERFGLYNEEVALADDRHLPVNPDCLAEHRAAVLLMSYEWMKRAWKRDDTNAGPDVTPAEASRPRPARSSGSCARCAAISGRRRRSRRCSTICAPCSPPGFTEAR